MSIVYSCSECGGEHRSRMVAHRRRDFDAVVSQLDEVLELCPHTRGWVTLSGGNLVWKEDMEHVGCWI